MASLDDTFMEIAVAMARRALGRAWPNPAVGAVLVAGNDCEPEIVSRGWTMPGGRPHAETQALGRAGARARGATLYVTLEPCAHHGRTPPCTDAIIAAGVTRVVCGLQDPDPRVSGGGIKKLRDAGIDVETSILTDKVLEVTRGHVLRISEQRPRICLKLAIGSDGRIAPGDGAPVWVTGTQARASGHLMRARADAILVGRGTIVADDPALTCRLPGMVDRSPVRVVLDSKLSTPRDAKVLENASDIPAWIFCSDDAADERRRSLSASGADVISVNCTEEGLLDPASIAAILAERGITRLLIEGGPRIARSFLDAGMIDDAVIFQGQSPARDNGLLPFVTDGVERLSDAGAFQTVGNRKLGPDVMKVYDKKHI